MKHTQSLLQVYLKLLQPTVLLCGLILTSSGVQAQNCTNEITVASGTQEFPCTDVSVTSDGDLFFDWSLPCPMGPYGIREGSWTFTFSTPVAGVTFNFGGLSNFSANPPIYEIVTLEINGAPFPFPNAGSPSSCGPQAVLNGSGGLEASPALGIGFCTNLNIPTSISTITVTNTYYNGDPLGIFFDIYFCCVPCETMAGLIPSAPLNLCPGETAIVPPAAPNVLPPGSILQYILFSDPVDTLGSILSISNTPSFAFDPAVMQEGLTYYITAIAGNELNGNVDQTDRCFDISNEAIPVTWRPKPTIVYSTDNLDVCVGTCVDIKVECSGEPPFTLNYNSTYTGPQTKSFADYFGIINLCVPLNATIDSLNIEAIKLTDKYCVCE